MMVSCPPPSTHLSLASPRPIAHSPSPINTRTSVICQGKRGIEGLIIFSFAKWGIGLRYVLGRIGVAVTEAEALVSGGGMLICWERVWAWELAINPLGLSRLAALSISPLTGRRVDLYLVSTAVNLWPMRTWRQRRPSP
ncbi:hypothetical protein E2C01_057326 [Portunus trituberculatus]|uniref:Uncharacterized protein n=1 Tax=Portunus trituberculatus TaxID=210409 RepID=A0A5B7GWH5_PORTR|nr:hypothetical protein [Portunus trituberculatus]